MIRVLCVDDHRVMLDGLALLIGRQPDMEVVASATSGEQAVELYSCHLPDITLMDLQLPTMSGLEAIGEIRRTHPDARIVVLTMYQGDEDIYRALEAGAAAYLLKDTLAEDLVNVIRQVHRQPSHPARCRGRAGRPQSPAISDTQGNRGRPPDRSGDAQQGNRRRARHQRTDCQGSRQNILAKLNVSDRSAVVAVAVRRGIIHIR